MLCKIVESRVLILSVEMKFKKNSCNNSHVNLISFCNLDNFIYEQYKNHQSLHYEICLLLIDDDII
jgi:hypothetical protein